MTDGSGSLVQYSTVVTVLQSSYFFCVLYVWTKRKNAAPSAPFSKWNNNNVALVSKRRGLSGLGPVALWLTVQCDNDVEEMNEKYESLSV